MGTAGTPGQVRPLRVSVIDWVAFISFIKLHALLATHTLVGLQDLLAPHTLVGLQALLAPHTLVGL